MKKYSSWEEFANEKAHIRRRLYNKAINGDLDAQRQVLEMTRDLKSIGNKRLRSLERGNMAYGAVYNRIMNFLDTQFNTNRFQSATSLKNDMDDLVLQLEHGLKFINNKLSVKENFKKQEQHRIERLHELDILPEDFSYRKSKDFLTFLGNEEATQTIDEYGTSEIIVDMIWGAYKKGGTKALNILQRSLAEYLDRDNKTTFNEAFERVGIKIEDYYAKWGKR